MFALFSILFFVSGTIIGSFLNVVAHRSVHGGSIAFDTSRCPHCKKKLAAKDLIPVVSFLFLRGKCRYCSKKISLQYPIVELVTGLLFVLAFGRFPLLNDLQSVLNLIFLLFLVCTLVPLFVTDLKNGVLPNSIVLPGIGLVFLLKILLLFSGAISLTELSVSLLAAFLVAAVFLAIVAVSAEKALGGGDIKLVFFIGLSLPVLEFLFSLFVGFLTGALVAVMLILLGKKKFGATIPLGPFLVLGAFVALFWGKEIIDLYLKLSV